MARRGPDALPLPARPLSARTGCESHGRAPGRSHRRSASNTSVSSAAAVPAEEGRSWNVVDADTWLARSGSLPPASAKRRAHLEAEAAPAAAPPVTHRGPPHQPSAAGQQGPLPQSALADQIFDAIDTNQDGVITRSELTKAIAAAPQAQMVPTRPSSARLPSGPSRHRSSSSRIGAPAASPRVAPSEARVGAECRAPSPASHCAEVNCAATREPSCSTTRATTRSSIGDASSRGVSPEPSVSFPEITPIDVGEVPPLISKVIDNVVAEEVEGLGECLNICAQRSRTLKLLGFQHLHFDARLQSFLEARARGVVRPIQEAMFLVKAFFAFRAAADQNFVWRWLEGRQHRLRTAVVEASDMGALSRAAIHRARGQLDQKLALLHEALLQAVFLGWRRCALERQAGELRHQLEEAATSGQEAASQSDHSRRVAQAFRARVERQCSDLMDAANVNVLRQCVTVWRGASVAARRGKQQKARTLTLAAGSSALAMQCSFVAWRGAVVEAKHAREAATASAKLNRELREKKAESMLHFSSSLMKTGMRLDTCFMAWRLAATRRKMKLQAQDRIVATMAARDEPLRIASFNAWRKAVEESKRELQASASAHSAAIAGKQKQLAGIVMSLMSSDRHFAVNCLHAWHSAIESARQMLIGKKRDLARALRFIDTSRGTLLAHAFHAWSHDVAAVQRQRLLEERQQLQAINKALQKHEEALHGKHIDVLTWQFAFLGGQSRSACFRAWRAQADRQRQQGMRRKRELAGIMRRMHGLDQMLLLQCFRALLEELASGRHERQLFEATKTLELTGTHLQELKLASELEQEQQKQKTLTAFARHFVKTGQELLRYVFGKWVSVTDAERSLSVSRRRTKAQAMAHAQMVVARTNQAFLCVALSCWSRAIMQEKHSRKLEACERNLSEKTASTQQGMARAHQKVLSALQRQFATEVRELLGACLSGWQKTIADSRAWRRKKEHTMSRGLQKIRLYEASLQSACLQSWCGATADAKRDRQLEDTRHRLEDTSKSLEERTRHLEEASRCLEETATTSRLQQARKREARIALVSRQIGNASLGQKHTCLVAWRNVAVAARQAKAQKAQSMSAAKGSIASAAAALLLQCLSCWARDAMAEKHGRLLGETQCQLATFSASASEGALRRRKRTLEALERQFALAAWQLLGCSFEQWRSSVLEARGKLRQRGVSFAQASYRIEGVDSALQARVMALWIGATMKGRFEKASSESHRVYRAAALERNRMAAIRISKLLRRLLVAQTVAAWRLAMRLSIQLTDDRRRYMRCAMLGRAYINKLRGKITEQACWLRWCFYWRTHSKSALASKEASKEAAAQDKKDFRSEPPAIFVRPMSARAKAFGMPGTDVTQHKISDAAPHFAPDDAIEVSSPWKVAQSRPQEDLFSKVDRNGDGVISRDEFETFVEGAEQRGLQASQGFVQGEVAVVIAPAAVVMPSAVNGQPRAGGPLAPAERHLLANQAMFSDNSYHALLQHNRRELREGGRSCCPPKDAGWASWAA